MQNLHEISLKMAEENLMNRIRVAGASILQNREDILNGNIKIKDKYEELFERLYNIDITTKTSKQEAIASLKQLVKDLGNVIYNEAYDDSEYLEKMISMIDINKKNLKYILESYEEQIQYENVLTQIKYHLSLKLSQKIDNKKTK